MILYGIPKRSGRFPWRKDGKTTAENKTKSQLDNAIENAKKSGFSDETIARIIEDACKDAE